jgi:hypothetical protein
MNYQIKKVANGFMVMPGPSYNRDCAYLDSDIHVFRTWRQASAWINAQFKGAK